MCYSGPMEGIIIRPARTSDKPVLRLALIELQEFERRAQSLQWLTCQRGPMRTFASGGA
jgi:hypothetical protein